MATDYIVFWMRNNALPIVGDNPLPKKGRDKMRARKVTRKRARGR